MHQLNSLQIAALILLRRRIKRRQVRTMWVHPLNLLRPSLGEHLKIEMMYCKHPQDFFQYTRMSPQQFDKILSMTTPELQMQDTNYRESIPPRHRLFVGLRYLVTGDSLKSIAVSFSIGKSTVRGIIEQINKALWKILAPIYLKVPKKDDWNQITLDFEEKWNFPNCLGAIDGKHVLMQSAPKSGSLFYNYKGTHSIVLMATCDADYRFTTVDIGGYGRQSDGGIFLNSALGKSITNGTFPFPDPKKLRGTEIVQPCTFVGDDAFALSVSMMKPFPEKIANDPQKRIFNYRLSRARRIIENVFGILASRFRIFRRNIIADPRNVILAVQATVSLHNFLRTEEMMMAPEQRRYCPDEYVDKDDLFNGEWRSDEASGFGDLNPSRTNNPTLLSKSMRENLSNYFMTTGKVSWQEERAFLNISN